MVVERTVSRFQDAVKIDWDDWKSWDWMQPSALPLTRASLRDNIRTRTVIGDIEWGILCWKPQFPTVQGGAQGM